VTSQSRADLALSFRVVRVFRGWKSCRLSVLGSRPDWRPFQRRCSSDLGNPVSARYGAGCVGRLTDPPEGGTPNGRSPDISNCPSHLVARGNAALLSGTGERIRRPSRLANGGETVCNTGSRKAREEAVQGKCESSSLIRTSILDRTRRFNSRVRSQGGPACPERFLKSRARAEDLRPRPIGT